MEYLISQTMEDRYSSSSEELEPIQKLSKEFFQVMVQLELWVNSTKKMSKSALDKLIGMYTKCVEQYDQFQDPIRYYFIEKIQNTLSEDKTIENLLETDLKKSLENSSKLSGSNDQLQQIQSRVNKRRLTNHKINVAINLKKVQVQNPKELTELVEGYCNTAMEQDKQIQEQLNEQQHAIQDRLRKRQNSQYETKMSRSNSLMVEQNLCLLEQLRLEFNNPQTIDLGHQKSASIDIESLPQEYIQKTMMVPTQQYKKINEKVKEKEKEKPKESSSDGMIGFLKKTLMSNKKNK